MDLLDRYVAAVRRNLPAAKAEDIAAELRDVLLERAEMREAALGRPLDKGEWESLLVEFGHPLVVAARYREKQSLIGPELYPFYLYSLKLFGALTLLGVAVMTVVRVVVNSDDPGQIVLHLLHSLWWAATTVAGTTTIVFALVERYGGFERYFRDWTPDDLPEVERTKEPGHFASAVEVALGVLILLWWVGLVPIPMMAGTSGFRLELAPVWAQLFWPVFGVLAVRLAYNLVRWLRPRWRWTRGALAIVSTVGAIIVAVLLYRAGHWVTVIPTGMAAEQAGRLQESLDLSLRIGIVAAALVWSWQGLQEGWRWMTGSRR
jgi:hypothetical protein